MAALDTPPRPAFISSPCQDKRPLKSPTLDVVWRPVLWCPLQYPSEFFSTALLDIILHPEYNSSLILRTDVITDIKLPGPEPQTDEVPAILMVEGYRPTRILRRNILSRRPERDAAIEQDCVFYSSASLDKADDTTLVILHPRLGPGQALPYYHPNVSALAFQYSVTMSAHTKHESDEDAELASLIIQVIARDPLDSSYADSSSRLYRTCVSLAQVVWKVGYGQMTGYKKRVTHDVIIDRSEYQSLYLILRKEAKTIVENWAEDTDPYKHVFEDIGIATFIMLLWKHTYPPIAQGSETPTPSDAPWHSWGRPPGGYIDLGCGNGLLVHLLVLSGYTEGIGVDLRARKSWSQYPLTTQSRLHVRSFDPTQPVLDKVFKPGTFLIGNHADELTPWLPLIATLSSASFLSIPCCSWGLDDKFTPPKGFNKRRKPDSETEFEKRLLASGAVKSAYATYLLWLFRQAEECGFVVEAETLRIPSTRNWALICRQRLSDEASTEKEHRQKVLEEIEIVRARGKFSTRTPEGRAGKEH